MKPAGKAKATPGRKRAPRKRPALTRDAILKAAVELADREGIAALSMRVLGRSLGVEAMSLYNLVRDKDDIIDSIVDLVVAEIEVPEIKDGDWRTALRARALSARAVFLKHPWVVALIESRVTSGPAKLEYLESVLARIGAAGFTGRAAHSVLLVLDSYIYGFTLQEVNWPFESETRPSPEIEAMVADFAGRYPNLAEIGQRVFSSDRNFDAWYESGLDLVLDGIERLRDAGLR